MKMYKGPHTTTKLPEMNSTFLISIRSKIWWILEPATLKEIENYLLLHTQVVKKHKAQLNHIIVNKKWKNSSLNWETCNTFSTGKYDHLNISGKFRLNLRTNKNKQKAGGWGKLVTNEHIILFYAVDVKSHFDVLKELDPSDNCWLHQQ